MNYVNSEDSVYKEIECGDLIKNKLSGELFILIHQKSVLVGGLIEYADEHYLIVNMSTGCVHNSYGNLTALRDHYTLVTKNQDLSLHY